MKFPLLFVIRHIFSDDNETESMEIFKKPAFLWISSLILIHRTFCHRSFTKLPTTATKPDPLQKLKSFPAFRKLKYPSYQRRAFESRRTTALTFAFRNSRAFGTVKDYWGFEEWEWWRPWAFGVEIAECAFGFYAEFS